MRAGGDFCADQLQMFRHRVRVCPGHDKPGAFAFGRTNGAKDVGPLRALVVGRARAGSAFGPPPGDLVFLADPRFILKPDLDRRPALFYADGLDQVGEVFLNASMASGSCA